MSPVFSPQSYIVYLKFCRCRISDSAPFLKPDDERFSGLDFTGSQGMQALWREGRGGYAENITTSGPVAGNKRPKRVQPFISRTTSSRCQWRSLSYPSSGPKGKLQVQRHPRNFSRRKMWIFISALRMEARLNLLIFAHSTLAPTISGIEKDHMFAQE